MAFSQNWSLEHLFRGGSRSPQLAQFLADIAQQIDTLHDTLEHPDSIRTVILLWQEIYEKLSQAGSFIGCHVAQDVNDTYAEQLQGTITELGAKLANAANALDEQLKAMPDTTFQAMLKESPFVPITYPLSYRRQRAKDKLPLNQEGLINDLAVDGYHGWSQFYGTLIGHVVIPVGERKLSWGQAYNLLSSPDRAVRKEVFESSNAVWKEHRQHFGPILNHIAGFRLKMYERRGWPVLKEPLDHNRMSNETLATMWRVIDTNKKPFILYLERKAQRLGLKKLHWYDLEAPISVEKGSTIPYDEAATFIIDRFSDMSPKMGAYAKHAFEKKWIEAEDRGGKRPGGFCTDIPLHKESRIFMTYSGTKESVFTLAHELGHAFHNHIIFDLPELARHFPMNLAETASTFAEMVVSEAALKQEKDMDKRMNLLDSKLHRAVTFLMNIQARFLFDVAFHEERKRGALSADRLCELMESCQKQAYGDALVEYHPYFWASKMHFSSTGLPFYNFPYTFGYLFSLGIYLKALEEESFEETYIALLADTGRMSTEDLAQKHLGVNLREETFWQSSLDFLIQGIQEYKRFTTEAQRHREEQDGRSRS